MPTLSDDPERPPSDAAPTAPVVTVLIPTRNRGESLARALAALDAQERPPDEVLVVDASDHPADPDTLAARYPDLPLQVIPATPGVCAQRNLGVARARGSWILLCDDDVEPPPAYLRTLLAHVRKQPSCGAVSGVVVHAAPGGGTHDGLEPPTVRHLLVSYLIQASVWADVEGASAGRLAAPLLALLRRGYRRRGNRWTRAGWPLVTQVRGEAFHTAFYGLGAALVRRDWLLASPYDERLGAHGIGDHYGVALGFPGERPVTVLTGLRIPHDRAPGNRLGEAEAHLRRALALDLFVRSSKRFPPSTPLWLVWSLLGKALLSAVRARPRSAWASLRAAGLVATGRNPLRRAARSSEPGP